MNRADYLQDQTVIDFVSWASTVLHDLPVELNISRKGTGTANGQCGPGVIGRIQGIDNITRTYQWRGQWNRNNIPTNSCDWISTRQSLVGLSNYLRDCIDQRDVGILLECCFEILKWGGDRNRNVGAGRFLNSLGRRLPRYLIDVTEQLSLDTADTDVFHHIGEMNSMLTKIHALASGDGLPIYDSRVAAAIASLVEMYRQSMNDPWRALPEKLIFKSVDNSLRRSVNGTVCLQGPLLNPGRITRDRSQRNISTRANEWSSSKVRLGWLLQQIIIEAEINGQPLFQQDTLYEESMRSKLHAFEAGLFMIGFDTSCLLPIYPEQRAA